MKPEDITKVEAYLKKTLNPSISLKARPKAGDSAEVYLDDEFIAIVYRDDDEGEVCFQLNMTILSEDL